MKKEIESKEELEYLSSIEDWKFVELESNEKESLEKLLKKASINTVKTLTKKKPINIRLSESDISRLKSLSLNQWIPYQTFISQVLHNYVRGKVK